MYTQIHTRTYTNTCTYTYTLSHTLSLTHTHTYAHTHAHALFLSHKNTHTHTHARTHIHALTDKSRLTFPTSFVAQSVCVYVCVYMCIYRYIEQRSIDTCVYTQTIQRMLSFAKEPHCCGALSQKIAMGRLKLSIKPSNAHSLF